MADWPMVTCERCGDGVQLDESDAIFADSIGYSDPTKCAWICEDCARREEAEDAP